MNESAFDQYFKHIDDVEGWLSKATAILSNRLMRHQSTAGLAGPICEIGIHHGKYFIALASELRRDEQAIAIDLFENQEENIDHSGMGDRHMFEGNVTKFLNPACVITLHANSTRLSPGDISKYGKIRFFSIDGGHTEAITANDLRLAERTIATGGIVALDDILHPSWTGVISGYVRYKREGGTLRPFALVPNKLFLTDGSSVASYRSFMRSEFPHLTDQQDREFIGDMVDVFRELLPARPRWTSRFKTKVRKRVKKIKRLMRH